MTEPDAESMAKSLMRFHGLLPRWSFRWMEPRRKFNRAGQCNWTKKSIDIQPHFVRCNHPFVVKKTILHEIAHALSPKRGHGKEWKRIARAVGHTGSTYYGKEVKKRLRRKLPR